MLYLGLTPKSQNTGILHTIFFHRFFPSLAPRSREVLDITLPYVEDVELDTMIEKRAAELARELDAERTHAHHSSRTRSAGGRGNISVQFFEKKRRRGWSTMRPFGVGGDEEVCWESWNVKVTVAEPRTESGASLPSYPIPCRTPILAPALHTVTSDYTNICLYTFVSYN